ncbi:hypothetical protein [Salipaludibacillus sp. CF4.18]|uniref:hypothetical protein n=1 Tax=Salipaludibacillus sp. CF4.18 TaxID=3373081 RepID=UPI003EE7AA7D
MDILRYVKKVNINSSVYLWLLFIEDVVKQVKNLARDNCEVVVYDLNKGCDTNDCEMKAKQYDVKSVPTVAIEC